MFVPAFGGLLRDAIGSTMYWEIHRAVIWFRSLLFLFLVTMDGTKGYPLLLETLKASTSPKVTEEP